jgi:hypothetical protein
MGWEWLAELDFASALLTGLGRLLGNEPVTPLKPARASRTDAGGGGQGVAALLFVDDGPDSVLGDPAGLHLVRSPTRAGSSSPPRLSSPFGVVPLPALSGRPSKFSLPPRGPGTAADGSGDGSASESGGLGSLVSKDTRQKVTSWAASKLPSGKGGPSTSLGAGLLSSTDGALMSFAAMMGRASASSGRDSARQRGE